MKIFGVLALAVVAIGFLARPEPVDACPPPSGDWFEWDFEYADAVFRGIAIESKDYSPPENRDRDNPQIMIPGHLEVTRFQVREVWKGAVGPSIYIVGFTGDSCAYRFDHPPGRIGREYVVFAHKWEKETKEAPDSALYKASVNDQGL